MNRVLKSLLVFFLLLSVNAQKNKNTRYKDIPLNGEAYRSLTADGAWCWFSDPRAVYHEGKYRRTYTAWVNSFGDIIAAYYDHDTQEITTKTVHDEFEVDDHDNPAILIDKKGYVLLFYAAHSEREGIRLSKSVGPESIEGWEDVRFVGKNPEKIIKRHGDKYTYANVVYLSKEDRIYLFWRSSDGKPTYSFSADGGYNWSVGKVFVDTGSKYKFKRPYMKVTTNHVDKIGFAFTEGHPRKEDSNSIFYMYLKEGIFRKADGTMIRPISQLPIKPDEVDIVYKGEASQKRICPCSQEVYKNPSLLEEMSKEKKDSTDASKSDEKKGKSWIWDIAFDKKENPVIVYARFPDDENHWYAYAKWDGKKWTSNDLINSGKWFPKTPENEWEWESNYSGGVVIDHEDTNKLYLSVKRDSIFEIESWTTGDGGQNWAKTKITKGSTKDNIRPFAVRNAKEGNPLQFIWMTNTFYEHYTKYNTALQLCLPYQKTDALTKKGILNVTRQVADWQIMNPAHGGPNASGSYGTFYNGLWELYKTKGKERYKDHYKDVGQHLKWRPTDLVFDPKAHVFFQPAIELYKKEKEQAYIKDIQWVMDMHLAWDSIHKKTPPGHDAWWTSPEALYLSPPAFARMSDAMEKEKGKYLDYAITHWKKTVTALYDKKRALFVEHSGSLDSNAVIKTESNGRVLVGLSQLIPYIPEDHEERAYFLTLYKELAASLINLPSKNGLWNETFFNSDSPDITGSAFLVWGLAWGVNEGVLNRNLFAPKIKKAWSALADKVNYHGKILLDDEKNRLVASGAFIAAGMQLHQMAEN